MKRLALALALAASLAAWGQSTEIANPDPKVEARLKTIAHELRCLVCQNQTIADSDAPLAVDLRKQVRVMIGDGKSDEEIRGYMVDRYGDFVLYKPPFNAVTAVLWVGPGLLIVGGFAALALMIRRRREAAVAAPPPDAARQREIEALLAADPDGKSRR
ncbi:MAG: cytochrome c-type biogenesis protein CcmH [Betaproteobacteria bacterium]|jgi:cytochrome c-type biogenesis protein CcmH|nr:cytochrome c-type biogenesis protein CcmH [Betaproteobacteria bacterium]